ncbi:MAG: protein kinase [Candidatus Melainabacteria bacterium]|nr:protein kinase [Candidatus Melainabacteria bacterium]
MDDLGNANETARKACLVCHKEFPANLATCPTDGIALTILDVPRDPMVGTLFCDRFQITEVLGGGGMGMVYRAKHLLMQRDVAIKILHTKMVGNADALKRFKVEAQAASTFSHPNILNVHDFGVSNQGQPYMVMDYLEGTTLTSLLDAEKRVPVVRAVNMFLQISSALAHAHSKDIIHRDVKPSNIMLVEFEGRKEFVKLVDFGIAKVLNPTIPEAENLTRTGEVFGSPLYMSPEQCKGMKLDARADIYSLGAVMYRVVAGRPIFNTADPLETMFKQVCEMPDAFAIACPDAEIPQQLEGVIFKCLAKDREERFQSMNDLRNELESVATHLRSLKPQLSVNTLSLEAERVSGRKVELDSDSWLSDLSQNTGALTPTPSFLNANVDDIVSTQLVAHSPAAHPPAAPPAPQEISQSAPPVVPQPAIAPNVVSSNNISFSTSSAPFQQNVEPHRPAVVVDKRDPTISIVIDKKSATFGAVALAVLLAIAGFLLLRPGASPPPDTASVNASHEKPVSSAAPAPVSSPASAPQSVSKPQSAAPAVARVAPKPSAPPKKKASKRKPKPYQFYDYTGKGYNPATAQRNSYSSPAAMPVRQSEPVAAQPVHVPAPQPSSSSYNNRNRSSRLDDVDLSRVTNSKPGRTVKRTIRQVFGLINKIAD